MNFAKEPVRACAKAPKVGNQTMQDGDKQFKLAVACVWVEWLRHCQGKMGANVHLLIPMNNPSKVQDGFGVEHYNLFDYTELELDHIKNKTHGNRYDLLNAQLLTPKLHQEKTDSGEYTDYRPKEYINWLKEKLK